MTNNFKVSQLYYQRLCEQYLRNLRGFAGGSGGEDGEPEGGEEQAGHVRGAGRRRQQLHAAVRRVGVPLGLRLGRRRR